MTMDNESRRMLWRAHPRFGLVDRVYLFSGPFGIGLLLVDWRIGLAVLLVVVPALFLWKQNELRRVLDAELGGRDDDEFAKAQAAGAKAESSFNQAEVQLGWAVWSEVPDATELVEVRSTADNRYLFRTERGFVQAGKDGIGYTTSEVSNLEVRGEGRIRPRVGRSAERPRATGG